MSDPTGLEGLPSLSVGNAIRGLLFALNGLSFVTSVWSMFDYGEAALNAFNQGDFWEGLGYLGLAALNAGTAVLSIIGMVSSVTLPPPGAAAGLVTAGVGGASARMVWVFIIDTPVLSRWIIQSLGPPALTAVLQAKIIPVENHHSIPYANKKYDFQSHDLVQKAGWNLEKDPRHHMLLGNHRGRHASSYLDAVKSRLDQAWQALLKATNGKPPTQLEADKALKGVADGIENDVMNGTLKPYKSKDVWKP